MNPSQKKSAAELKQMRKICVVDIAHQDLFYNYLDEFGNKYNQDGVLVETVGNAEITQDFKQDPKLKPKEKVD
jgi:hypothetical protein